MEIREKYQLKASAQLNDWLIWIEQIKRNVAVRSGVPFVEQQKIVQDLEFRYRETRLRLNELKNANEAHWEVAKQGVERAMIDLKQALDRAEPIQPGKSLELQDSRSRSGEAFFRKE